MSSAVSQILMKAFFVIVIATLIFASARPHFSENSQITSDQDNTASNMYEGDLKPWQVEALIQRLAEMNNQAAWRDRSINEVKRQSRYRQCYFNPISCFKK